MRKNENILNWYYHIWCFKVFLKQADKKSRDNDIVVNVFLKKDIVGQCQYDTHDPFVNVYFGKYSPPHNGYPA